VCANPLYVLVMMVKNKWYFINRSVLSKKKTTAVEPAWLFFLNQDSINYKRLSLKCCYCCCHRCKTDANIDFTMHKKRWVFFVLKMYMGLFVRWSIFLKRIHFDILCWFRVSCRRGVRLLLHRIVWSPHTFEFWKKKKKWFSRALLL